MEVQREKAFQVCNYVFEDSEVRDTMEILRI